MIQNVIYRKYRPSKFKDVLGQKNIIEVLQAQIATNRIANSYLFCGQHGIGKTTVARIFAKAVNCLNFPKDFDVCNNCKNCKHFESTSLNDFIEIDGASNRGIEEIRNISEQIRYGPSVLKYKIYIIDEAHMITVPAFNAFLKTLEEPPHYVIFILATTEPHKILETVLSRLQIFEFKRASKDDIREKLERILKEESLKFDSRSIEYLSSLGKGSYRDAESNLSKILSSGKKELNLKLVKEILGKIDYIELQSYLGLIVDLKEKEAILFLHGLIKSIPDIKIFGENFLIYLRNIVFASYGREILDSEDLTEEEIIGLLATTKKIKQESILKLFDIYRNAYENSYQYPSQYIPYEIATIEAIKFLTKP